MGTNVGQWAVQVLEQGLPPLPDRLERGETVPAAVLKGDRVGGVVFVRLWKSGQPDSEIAIMHPAEDGSWEAPSSWGGGPWIEDPLVRPADGWDGEPVVWLGHCGAYTQGDADGVRAEAGAAALRVAAIRVEQGGRTWSVPVDSPCGAFIVVMESLQPAGLYALDEHGAVLGSGVELEDISDLMRHEWWPQLPAEGSPAVRYDFEPTADE